MVGRVQNPGPVENLGPEQEQASTLEPTEERTLEPTEEATLE